MIPPEGIVLQDRDGNVVDFSAFRGKYVYIDMWASWCVPCLREVPELQKLEKTLKNKKVAAAALEIMKARLTAGFDCDKNYRRYL